MNTFCDNRLVTSYLPFGYSQVAVFNMQEKAIGSLRKIFAEINLCDDVTRIINSEGNDATTSTAEDTRP